MDSQNLSSTSLATTSLATTSLKTKSLANSSVEATSLATWVFAIHRALTELNYDADAIMRGVGFDFSSLTSTTQRVPKDILNAIWEAAENATQDDAFCISTFPHLNDPYLNALITSTQASSSVKQAIQLLLKYYHVVTSSSKLDVKISNCVELHITPIEESSTVSSQDVDLVFGLISKYGSVLPAKEVQPLAVFMTRSEPKNIEAYKKHYDCPLHFGFTSNQLHFPLEVLTAEIPSANPALSDHVEKYLAEQTLPKNNFSISELVSRTIEDLICDGTPKLKDIAVVLSTSERTLQRKLKSENLNFSEILNAVRIKLAKKHLQNTSMPIQNISYQLGFTEPGNFVRFFKTQTGLTPKAFAKSCTK